MALIFNNLVINKNSNKFMPFLLNLVSGRRRLLNSGEFAHILSMLEKSTHSDFTTDETTLYKKLLDEKQFLDEKQLAIIENHMLESNYYDTADNQNNELTFTVQLTEDCNMHCAFCYQRSHTDRQSHMTEEKIDAIYDFYKSCKNKYGNIPQPSLIAITGGESLLNQKNVDLVNHIATKWPETSIGLSTNASNLTKFYDQLPINRFKDVSISIDGLEEVHLRSRNPDASVSETFYYDILTGINQLIKDSIPVKVKSVVTRENYINFPQLAEFLRNEGILGSPGVEHIAGVALDYMNPLDIDEILNNANDVFKIQSYIRENCGNQVVTYSSLAHLQGIIMRNENKPYVPRSVRCSMNFLLKCFFAPNGNVYFCDCIDKEKGVIGTYYPEISLDEDAIDTLKSRSVVKIEKCKECPYKLVCLGNCPLASLAKDEEMSCGIFARPDILDNLEFPYYERASKAGTAVAQEGVEVQ